MLNIIFTKQINLSWSDNFKEGKAYYVATLYGGHLGMAIDIERDTIDDLLDALQPHCIYEELIQQVDSNDSDIMYDTLEWAHYRYNLLGKEYIMQVN